MAGLLYSEAQYNRAKELREGGKTYTEIEGVMKISRNSIYYMLNHTNKVKRVFINRKKAIIRKDGDFGMQEMDLSALPDNILFKHDTSYII